MKAEFPRKVQFVLPRTFVKSRYKVLYGGRGGIKSWTFARALLLHGSERRLKILCARETQTSIADSVHALLKLQIAYLGLDAFYTVEKGKIYGANGTEFVFFGLRHNTADIKSCEGVDIAWVEEAESVSKSSWDILGPTIRKDGSEIWVSFNPLLEQDATWQRFVVRPPADAIVVKTTYRDNPWFPEVLKNEMEECRARRPDDYSHIWEGCCVSTLEGAIYQQELRKVDQEGRITQVRYDATRPVHTFWDLGYGDSTSIWFVQAFPFEYRIIDFLQNNREPLTWYQKELQAKPYVYGTHFLPHDARARQLGSGKSVEELMRTAGMRVQIVPNLSIADGINAARTIFGQCWFDGEKCADGLQALRHYQWGELATGQVTREPKHDENSHSADAFRMFAIGIRPERKKPPQQAGGQYKVTAWS